MLNILHNKLNEITNIISVEQATDNNFIIQYEDPSSITPEQQNQINTILNAWPLEILKINKIQQLDNKWIADINNGFETSYGWKLGLSNNDVTLLTGAFLLGKEASNMNLSQSTTIIDKDGISHTIPINDLTVLMLQYGQYRTQLSTIYSQIKTLIEQATSSQDLDNIII